MSFWPQLPSHLYREPSNPYVAGHRQGIHSNWWNLDLRNRPKTTTFFRPIFVSSLICCVTFQTLQQLRLQHLVWFLVQQFWLKNNSVDLGYQRGWHTFLLPWISFVWDIALSICFREPSWRGALHFLELENNWKSFCDYVTPTSCACKLGVEVLGKRGC